MNRRLIFAFAAVSIAAAAGLARAEQPATLPGVASQAPEEESAASKQMAEPVLADTGAAERATRPLASEKAAPAANVFSEAPEEPDDAKPAAEPHAAAQAPQAEPGEPAGTGAKPAAAPARTTLDIPPASPAELAGLRTAISRLPGVDTDEDRNEQSALAAFYESRGYAPVWLTPAGSLTPKGTSAAAEIKRANEWGLDPRDFPLPAWPAGGAAANPAPEAIAAAEIKISLAVLKYGRYARGGRILNPSEQLSSYLDRRPQLLKPAAILDGIAAADNADAYLRGLHPQHPQFEKLRQKYLAALGSHGRQQGADVKRLLANMEEWRWMPADMNDLYVWNNIPEFTQRVVMNGEVLRKERIVAGLIDKQTPIFSRPLRKITFRPTWIVPDSIKVRELVPDMMRGGHLMREWGLEVLKDGQPVNWRKINWAAADIRTYEVIQQNGPKSVMGKVKFSFPSQHTVFMHDALERDKWMFRVAQRTYSHGCMRVANPIGLAEILLREDKGWDTARTREALNTGGNNNEIPLERKVMVHITYFTALVDDDGKLHTFPDVYGHEHRITLALEGKWNQIVKGRDHLAPVELNTVSTRSRHYAEDDGEEPRAWRRSGPRNPYGAYGSYGPYSSSNYRGGSFMDSLFGGYR